MRTYVAKWRHMEVNIFRAVAHHEQLRHGLHMEGGMRQHGRLWRRCCAGCEAQHRGAVAWGTQHQLSASMPGYEGLSAMCAVQCSR